jgi:hypothetical protein
MLTPNLFEELLATYPAEKRELARRVYIRFADGDSTQFFSQLFIVLDIYAHYYDRIPLAVIDANQSAHSNLAKLRDEINLLAQAMDRRNVSITNHAERTDELCHQAIAACNDTADKVEDLVKNIGTQVNTQAIVDGIHAEVEKGIRDGIIRPFVEHTQELGKKVLPALEEIKEASVEAHTLWMKHIWKTAWAGSFLFTLTLFFFALFGIYKLFENYSERKAAEHIANVERVMIYNQDAFRQLAIAQVRVNVVRTHDTNGMKNPRNFALMVENADGAEMRDVDGHPNGMVFFNSNLSEEMIQGIQAELDKAAQKLKQTEK